MCACVCAIDECFVVSSSFLQCRWLSGCEEEQVEPEDWRREFRLRDGEMERTASFSPTNRAKEWSSFMYHTINIKQNHTQIPWCHVLCCLFYFEVFSCLPLVPLGPLFMSITCVSLCALPLTVLSCVPLPQCSNGPGLLWSMGLHLVPWTKWSPMFSLMFMIFGCFVDATPCHTMPCPALARLVERFLVVLLINSLLHYNQHLGPSFSSLFLTHFQSFPLGFSTSKIQIQICYIFRRIVNDEA